MTTENKPKILHLVSWFPTKESPTLGNFCFKHIEAAGKESEAVVLTASVEDVKKRTITTEQKNNYLLVKVCQPKRKMPLKRWEKLGEKYQLFKAYNKGFSFIKEQLFIPDLLHLHIALPMGIMALYWKKRYGLNYLLTEHWSVYLPEDNRLGKNKISKKLKAITKNASAITAVSNLLKNNMIGKKLNSRFAIVPNIVDTSVFQPTVSEKKDKIVLLHISTLNDEEKNFSGILRVIKEISKKRNDFILQVIHDDPNPYFEAIVKKEKLEEVVFFLGQKKHEEVVKYIQHSDFMVVFSNFETFSCVVAESLACGKPVVGTRTGAIVEMLDNQRGILVNSGDEIGLQNAIEEMLNQYSNYKSEELSNYAKANFSPEIVGKQFYEIYKNLIEQQ